MPGSVIVVLYGSYMYNFTRNCQIVFQDGYIILHPHQSCMRDPLALHLCQYLTFIHLIFSLGQVALPDPQIVDFLQLYCLNYFAFEYITHEYLYGMRYGFIFIVFHIDIKYAIVINQIFKNFYLFIYLFLAVLGLRCCVQAVSSCGEQGLLFIAVCRLLIAMASFVAEHELQARSLQQLQHEDSVLVARGLQSAGSVVVVHGLSCSAACGIFPDQRSNPYPLHWQADS